MKKIASTLCGVMLAGLLALLFVSCTNQDIVPTQEITELRFNVQVNNASAPDTKVLKTGWQNGDVIYAFFKVTDGSGTPGYLNPMKYITLTYNSATGEWEGAKGGDLSNVADLGTEGVMYGVFFPFGGVTVASDGESGVTFRTKNANPALNDLPIYTYYMSGSTDYFITTEGDIATLYGKFNLAMPDNYVWFFIDKDGSNYYTDGKYRLSVEGIYPVACTSFKAGVFSETPGSIPSNPLKQNGQWNGQPMWGYCYANDGKSGIAFTGKVDNTWASSSDHKFVLFSDGDPAVARTITGSLDVTSHQHPSVKLKAPTPKTSDGYINGWELAVVTPTTTELSDGKKWANWNLGASDVDGKGMYFMWGGLIEPKNYISNGSLTERMIGNHNLVDEYAIYDAARAYLGADWRMPTYDELNGLGTTRTPWITAGNSENIKVGTAGSEEYKPTVEGWKAVKGNSIFLPITGTYDGGGDGKNMRETSYAWYWCSNQNSPKPYHIRFGKTWDGGMSTASYREWGVPIRPIKIN